MNKDDLKKIHGEHSWGATRLSWSINPNRDTSKPYEKARDSLSKEDRQRINDIKYRQTFGDDKDPLFGADDD